MIFSFENLAFEVNQHRSRKEMTKVLDACASGSYILGDNREYNVVYHSIVVYPEHLIRGSELVGYQDEIGFGIGILNQIIGSVPSALLLQNSFVVGYDCEVVAFGLKSGSKLYTKSFDTPVQSFMGLELTRFLVFTDIGVVSFRENGTEIWRYEKDLVTDRFAVSGNLYLSFMDSDSVKLDLDTGKVLL